MFTPQRERHVPAGFRRPHRDHGEDHAKGEPPGPADRGEEEPLVDPPLEAGGTGSRTRLPRRGRRRELDLHPAEKNPSEGVLRKRFWIIVMPAAKKGSRK